MDAPTLFFSSHFSDVDIKKKRTDDRHGVLLHHIIVVYFLHSFCGYNLVRVQCHHCIPRLHLCSSMAICSEISPRSSVVFAFSQDQDVLRSKSKLEQSLRLDYLREG